MIDHRNKAQSNAVATSLARSFILIGVALFIVERLTHLADGSLPLQMFPGVLALIGVALLFSRISRALTTLMVFLIAAGIIGFVIFGRTLGLPGAPDFFFQAYVEPVNGATSADISLDIGAQMLVVNALADPKALLSTRVDLGSTLDEQSSGDRQRVVSVHHSNDGFSVLTDLFQSGPKQWKVDLNPTVPTNLHVSSNTTPMQLNLSSAHLTGLSIDGNTGAIAATLSSAGDPYTAVITVNSADSTLTLPDGAAVNLSLSTNTGNVTIDLPDNAAVQLTAAGAGSVDAPAFLAPVTTAPIPGNGVWQTANFDGAQRPIVIRFQTGTGRLTVR